jgi:hypothetical protein
MSEVITRDTLPKRPHPGLVICYSYLWHREAQKKQIEGLKNRPCAVVLSYEKIPQFPDRVGPLGLFKKNSRLPKAVSAYLLIASMMACT